MFVPIFKTIFRKRLIQFENTSNKVIQLIENRFVYTNKTDHKDPSLFHHLLNEREQLIAKNNSFHEELQDHNFARFVHDLFGGSVESSSNTLAWLLLLMKSCPKYESILREEVNDVIGERDPTIDDMSQCNYVMAFLSETMRFRPSFPISVPHKCLQDYKHGIYVITVPDRSYEVVWSKHFTS